jgi:serine/threonine-protein kinase
MEVSSDDSQFNDIWIFDLERGTRSRVTFEDGWDYLPVWSPDGRRIAWSHSDPTTGGWHVYVRDVDGSTPPQHRYGQGREVAWATAFSPDGRSIAVSQTVEGEGGITMISDAGSDPPAALVDHPAYPERNPSFSADGKWVSWASWETGQPELYVASYPELRNRRQLSTASVGYPAIAFWGAGEIIYLAPDGSFMSVPVRDAGTYLELGEPKPLFKLDGLTAVGVSPDGQQFAVVVPSETARGQFSDDGLMLVVNWTADLQKKRP